MLDTRFSAAPCARDKAPISPPVSLRGYYGLIRLVMELGAFLSSTALLIEFQFLLDAWLGIVKEGKLSKRKRVLE